MGLHTDRRKEDREIWRAFRHHSRTFSLAAHLLPRPVRLPVATLYLFCRTVDTIADDRVLEIGEAGALEEVEALRRKLDRTLVGRPPDEMLWRRLAEVHTQFHLPPGPLYELIDGAVWDLTGRPVADPADLLAYSGLVGGSVGAMMLPFLVTERGQMRALEPLARDLGNAMQVTNICRDVGEDWRRLKRVYLPLEWCEEFGVHPKGLCDQAIPDPYPRLMERMMSVAESLFHRSLSGVEQLRNPVRKGITAALRLYREILNEVRSNGYDNIQRRAFVPAARKVSVLLRDDYERRRSGLLKAHDYLTNGV